MGNSKGYIPWNKGLKGSQVAWNKGLTKETCESLRSASLTLMGHPKFGDCGNYVRTSEIKLKNRIAQLGNYDGDNNPNWKGGVSWQHGEQWNKVRKLVYERDEHKCYVCKGSTVLQAHHIVPYFILEPYGLEYELMYMITLCKLHHYRVDNILRRKEYQDIVRTVTIEKIAELGRNILTFVKNEYDVTKRDLMPISSIDLALLQSAYRTLIAEFTVLQVTCEAFQGKITLCG